MMRSRGIGFLTVLGSVCSFALLIGVSGCAKSDDATASKAVSAPYQADSAKVQTGAVTMDPAPMHTAARQPGAERSVVRQASLSVDVDSLDKAEKRMKESIALHGGYIDHEEGDNLAGETPVLRLTIRVPEKSFEDVVTGFEALGHRTQKTISASDLTEQILDADAVIKQVQQDGKLSTFPSTQEQLRQILAQREQLAAKAAMSTIDLTLQQKASAAEATAANASWGNDTWNSALSSALGAFRVLGGGAIWLLAYSPIWGVALFGGIWIYRVRKRTGGRTQIA